MTIPILDAKQEVADHQAHKHVDFHEDRQAQVDGTHPEDHIRPHVTPLGTIQIGFEWDDQVRGRHVGIVDAPTPQEAPEEPESKAHQHHTVAPETGPHIGLTFKLSPDKGNGNLGNGKREALVLDPLPAHDNGHGESARKDQRNEDKPGRHAFPPIGQRNVTGQKVLHPGQAQHIVGLHHKTCLLVSREAVPLRFRRDGASLVSVLEGPNAAKARQNQFESTLALKSERDPDSLSHRSRNGQTVGTKALKASLVDERTQLRGSGVEDFFGKGIRVVIVDPAIVDRVCPQIGGPGQHTDHIGFIEQNPRLTPCSDGDTNAKGRNRFGLCVGQDGQIPQEALLILHFLPGHLAPGLNVG